MALGSDCLLPLLAVCAALQSDLVQSAPNVIAQFGEDVTLSFRFPSKLGMDLQRLTLSWQKEQEGAETIMVYSYYYGRDQLARQAEAYRNRTWLDPEGLTLGNASLTLRGIRIQDEGVYHCYVYSELGTSSEHWELIVGAPFSEPQLTFSLSSDGVTLTVHTGGGYPAATVRWLDELGRNITAEGATEQQVDEQGLYHVTSWVMVLPETHSTRLTFLLTPHVLGAPITWPLRMELSPGLLGSLASCLWRRLAVICAACLSIILLAVAFVYGSSWSPASSCSWRKAKEGEGEASCPISTGLRSEQAARSCQLGLSSRGSARAELEPQGARSTTTLLPSSSSG